MEHVALILFRTGKEESKKAPPNSISPVTSTNLGIILQNFLTFNSNPFATRSSLVSVPNY